MSESWVKAVVTVSIIALVAAMVIQVMSLFSAPATIVVAPTTTALPTVTPLAVAAEDAVPLPTLPPPTTTPAPPPTVDPVLAAATPVRIAPPTTTPDLLSPLTIEKLRQRRYGADGEIVLLSTIAQTMTHNTYYFYYVSDGLRISGVAKYPQGNPPFPVIILVHGEEPIDSYVSGKSTEEAADYYASRGYITFAPDMRNYGQSDPGPDDFFIGYAVDVLNLAALVPRFAGAHGGKVGLWGHSLGGTIAMTAAVTRPDLFDSVVLYSTMSTDAAENWRLLSSTWAAPTMAAWAQRYGGTPDQVPEVYRRVSASNHLNDAPPVSLHHATGDPVAPYSLSQQLGETLTSRGRYVEFSPYEVSTHVFTDYAFQVFLERSLDFFERSVRNAR